MQIEPTDRKKSLAKCVTTSALLETGRLARNKRIPKPKAAIQELHLSP